MNPSAEGLKDRAATSPALFNRCVLNWFGDWSDEALFHVGKEFTSKLDIERLNVSLFLSLSPPPPIVLGARAFIFQSIHTSHFQYSPPDYFPVAFKGLPQPPTYRDAVTNAIVHVHQTLHKANVRLVKRGSRTMAITPRHYLDFINHYVSVEVFNPSPAMISSCASMLISGSIFRA